MGFVLSDILADLERVSDHCSNIAGCLIEMKHEELEIHEYLRSVKTDSKSFAEAYGAFKAEFSI